MVEKGSTGKVIEAHPLADKKGLPKCSPFLSGNKPRSWITRSQEY